MGRQEVKDCPWLTTEFGYKPTKLVSEPGQWKNEESNTQEPALVDQRILHRENQAQEENQGQDGTTGNHTAEGPEHRSYGGHGVLSSLLDHFWRGRGDVIGVFLQEQTKAQVFLNSLEFVL